MKNNIHNIVKNEILKEVKLGNTSLHGFYKNGNHKKERADLDWFTLARLRAKKEFKHIFPKKRKDKVERDLSHISNEKLKNAFGYDNNYYLNDKKHIPEKYQYLTDYFVKQMPNDIERNVKQNLNGDSYISMEDTNIVGTKTIHFYFKTEDYRYKSINIFFNNNALLIDDSQQIIEFPYDLNLNNILNIKDPALFYKKIRKMTELSLNVITNFIEASANPTKDKEYSYPLFYGDRTYYLPNYQNNSIFCFSNKITLFMNTMYSANFFSAFDSHRNEFKYITKEAYYRLLEMLKKANKTIVNYIFEEISKSYPEAKRFINNNDEEE